MTRDASAGCLSCVAFFLCISGIYAIVEGYYLLALLLCMPLICWMLYVILNHKSLKGEDKFSAKVCFSLVTLIFTIAGIMVIAYEEYFKAILLCIPLICFLSYVIYYWIAIVPKEDSWNAIRRMYNLPNILDKEEEEQWSKEFQQLIDTELNKISEPEKKNDLQQCQHIVKKMIKDESFENLHRAFRFTGCHLIVTDNDGKIITKIV